MAGAKTVHVVVFDVSGSMASPLNLRENANKADNKSRDLDSKRAQTVFDVICRLAEDGIAEGKGQPFVKVPVFWSARKSRPV